MYGDRFRLSITGVTGVPSRVRRFRFLHQQETRRAVTLLRDHGDAAPGRVVADYLEHRSTDRILRRADISLLGNPPRGRRGGGGMGSADQWRI